MLTGVTWCRAIAGIDAEDADEARDFLLPAVLEIVREMFEQQMEYRLDETAPVITRPATPDEAVYRWPKQ